MFITSASMYETLAMKLIARRFLKLCRGLFFYPVLESGRLL